MSDKKETVAVFFGGVTPEHDISIITAISSVIRPLELSGNYDVMPIYIAKDGAWFSDETMKDVRTFTDGKIERLCETLKPLIVSFDGGLSVVTKTGLRTASTRINIAFPAMHGSNGEDGSLMGLLRMANIPFVGCDMPASVVAMDKLLAKQVAQANGIPVAKYEYLNGDTYAKKPKPIVEAIAKSLKFPVFIKPTHLGSSIGITRAKNREELRNGIEVAAFYDNKIIVEEAIKNLIEVTVPIVGNEDMKPALVERPLVDGDKVFDFDTKYLHGAKKLGNRKQGQGSQGYSELPAKLPKDLYAKAVSTAKAVYKAVECEGTARVDLLIDSKTNVVYFNEINPLPGSLYSHNWRKAGVSNVVLATKLIMLAKKRYEKQKKLEKTFSTNFLKQFE